MGKLCLAFGLSGLRVLGFLIEPLLPSSEIHRVVGEPRRFERRWTRDDGVKPDELKIITWNIERGTEYDSILKALREADADILLLQEVDQYCHRTGYRDVARDLADALQMNWLAAGEFQEIGEARGPRPAITGQAILSKFPIQDASALNFAHQDRWRWSINPVQPRRGGRIALKARTAGITLYNTHIESGGNEKLQRRQIGEILADEARESHEGPVVIGGDFNNGPLLQASMFGSLSAAAFADALSDVASRGPTSLGEVEPIDWIFVKNMTPAHGRVLSLVEASDHFPVAASLASIPRLALSR